MATTADVVVVGRGVIGASAFVHLHTFGQHCVARCHRLLGSRHFEMAWVDLNNQEQ